MSRLEPSVHVTIHRAVLESIFDECDRYDRHETGGKLIGTYQANGKGRLGITVSGVIEPGPNAARSSTSLFQDGDYQESVFRTLEQRHPEIEHLGSWHTHHVNGFPTLSGGDRETYHRVVDHEKHNTDFFYALLVTSRNAGARNIDRYSVKHFVLFRKIPGELEIPPSRVRILDRPIIWPSTGDVPGAAVPGEAKPIAGAADQRARDNEFFKELFPDLRPLLSRKTGRVYWRGRIALVDESVAEVVAAELEEDGQAVYRVVVTEEPAALMELSKAFSEKRFRSAREAVALFERHLNREIFRNRTRESSRPPPAQEGK